MLKRYFAKEEDQVKEISTSALEDVAMANPMFVINDINQTDDSFQEGIPFLVFKQQETWHDVFLDTDLPDIERNTILTMLESFSNTVMDIPRETNETANLITLSDYTPIKVQQYS